jgi:hypothetical protein
LRQRPAVGAALLAVLTALSFATAAIVLHAKTSKLELEVRALTRCFIPPGHGALAQRPCVPRHGRPTPSVARVVFTVRDSVRDATVELLGGDPRYHRTFRSGTPLVAGRRYAFTWRGGDDSGRPAPAGKYRLRVDMPTLRRNIIYPPPIRLVR